MPTGFPWLQIGHTDVDSPLAPLLPWIGSHAAGLLAVGAAMLAGMATARAPRWRSSIGLVAVVAVAVTTVLLAENKHMSASSDAVRAEALASGSLHATLLQPALDTSHKFDRARLSKHLQQLMSPGTRAGDGAILIASETAIPTTGLVNDQEYAQFTVELREHLAQHSSDRAA